jgi:hypothetical protein
MTNNTHSSTKLELGKSGTSKKTPLQPKIILIMLGIIGLGTVVPVTAISSKFEGRIEIKLGIEGGQVLIEGSKPPPFVST